MILKIKKEVVKEIEVDFSLIPEKIYDLINGKIRTYKLNEESMDYSYSSIWLRYETDDGKLINVRSTQGEDGKYKTDSRWTFKQAIKKLDQAIADNESTKKSAEKRVWNLSEERVEAIKKYKEVNND